MKTSLSLKILSLLLIVYTSIFSIGCNKKTSNNTSDAKQGGQDSGGGNTKGSTNAQVEYYLKDKNELKYELREILNTITGDRERFLYMPKNPELIEKFKLAVNEVTDGLPGVTLEFASIGTGTTGMDFYTKEGQEAYEKYEKFLEEKSKIMKSAKADSDVAIDYQEKFFYGIIGHSMPSNDTLRLVYHLNIVHKSTCKDRHSNNKAGSVTDFNKDATICISTSELEKVAPDSLRKQTHALLIHEISHLLGFYESDALLIHEFVLRNYDQLIKKNNSAYSLRKVLFDKPKQLFYILSNITKSYTKKDFLNLDNYHYESGLSDAFSLLQLTNEELIHVIRSYRNHLELNARETDLNETQVLDLMKKFDPFIIEIESLSDFYNNIMFIADYKNPEHKSYIASHKQYLSKKMKREDFYFLHDRMNFLSKKLKELYLELNSLNSIDEVIF